MRLVSYTIDKQSWRKIKYCDISVYICHLKPGAWMEMHREIIARTVSSEMTVVKGSE